MNYNESKNLLLDELSDTDNTWPGRVARQLLHELGDPKTELKFIQRNWLLMAKGHSLVSYQYLNSSRIPRGATSLQVTFEHHDETVGEWVHIADELTPYTE